MIPFRYSTRLAPRLAAAVTAATLLMGVSHAAAWVGVFTNAHVDGCVVTVTGDVLHESSGAYYLTATAKAPIVAPQTTGQVVYKAKLTYTGSHTIRIDRKSYQYDDFGVTLGPTDGLLSGGAYKLAITATDKDGDPTAVLNNPVTVTVGACPGGSQGGAATPELGSGELLATGIVSIGAVFLYRRRRAPRTS